MSLRLRGHGCSFPTVGLVAGQTIRCSFCGQPSRVESANPPWVVAMSRREIRRWRKSRNGEGVRHG